MLLQQQDYLELGGYTAADYYENGKGMLGITRGQIGAFYERELEYNIQLTHTEENGLPIVNQAGDLSKPTTIDEAGFAVLDSGVARFPFIGAEEDKPAGVATSGASTQAGDNTVSVGGVRGTEFVQFGTAVDGIFQGALVGSSIIANSSDGTVEGYGPDENNYAQIGGLTSTAAANEQPLASFSSSNALTYASGSSYTPNAQAGSKKTGDRIVYVATFKENNPALKLIMIYLILQVHIELQLKEFIQLQKLVSSISIFQILVFLM